MGLNKDRGLSSLISDMDTVYSKELGFDKNQSTMIEIDQISPNPFQPRKNFDQEALDELANSIKEFGLIQPIIVFKKNNKFILIAGERRLRAVKALGKKEILAFIADIDENKLRELALIENIQRENLNPIELANSYKDLMQVHKITQENLAELIHKSRTQITNTLRLLNLDIRTQELIASGKISQGHAKVLVGLDQKDEKMYPSIMLATMAIFLAMIVILNSMLYKPLLKFMDERNDSIKNDENKVKENSQEVLGVNDELEAIHINTREEIQKIKQSAIVAAKEEAEQTLRSKKEELERKMAGFYADLAVQKKELQEHLNIHSPELKQALQNNIKKI